MWLALGDYRGPMQARCLVRYAMARSDECMEERSYRAFVTDCVGALVGADRRWVDGEASHEEKDAQSIIDDVVSRGGLEVIG